MAYRIIPKQRKKAPHFKIAFETITNGRRHQRDVPRDEWWSLGFTPSMTIEEARARRDSLNAKEKLTRDESKRQKALARIDKDNLTTLANVPAPLVEEYKRKLFSRTHQTKKLEFYWKATVSILAEVGLEPHLWADNTGKFYDIFSARHYSISYVRTLVPMLNGWGMFYSRKTQKFFEPLKVPKGHERERIADANYASVKGGNKESDPLTPGMLEGARAALKPEHYTWLYLSVWLGLRPIEIDNLKDRKTWKLETHGSLTVLAIYQSKLTAVAREKRWKRIPLFLAEHGPIPDMIAGGEFRRPLSKSMTGWFGGDVGLYGGRKGFEDLMHSRGQKLENISQWLGHTSIERTWKSYKDKKIVRVD